MKSNVLCACMIATLLFSVATFGEIIEDGTGINTSESVAAGKGNPSPQSKYDERWYSETTTEAGYFDWELEVRAEASCSCYVNGGWAEAVADASGAAASPYTVISVDAYVCITTGDERDGPYSDEASSETGTRWFDAYECVSGMCDCFVWAAIEEGSESTANASASSMGYVNLSE